MKRQRIYYGYVIVGFAFLMMCTQWAVIYSFGVFLKPLTDEFGWTRAMTAGAFSVSSILGGLTAVYLGWLTDRFGPRPVMSICGFLLGSGCILLSRIDGIIGYYFALGIVVGLAMGGQFTPLLSTIARWFSVRRGMMSGVVAAGVGVGALLGPHIASRLISAYGWRTAYLIIGVAALAAMLTSAQFMRRKPEWMPPAENNAFNLSSPENMKNDRPIGLVQAAGSYQFWLFVLTGFCYGYALFSLTVHVVVHAIDIGTPTMLAVSILSTFGGLSILGKVIFGKVLDRVGSKPVMFAGFMMSAAAYFCLIFARSGAAIFLGAALFGFFYGAITISISPMTAMMFGLRSHGLIMGVHGTGVTLGGALGPLVTGYIFDYLRDYRMAFVLGMLICIAGCSATARMIPGRLVIRPR